MTERMLRKHGYNVLTAASPSQALAIARSRSSEISALVSDVMMPEMTGIELARELSGIVPNAKKLFISGYADPLQSSVAQHGHFIQKPYTTEALIKALRLALDEDAASPLAG
jgi:CheY-like chemotaxis protein